MPGRQVLVRVLNPVQAFNQVIPPGLDPVDDCADLGSCCRVYRMTLAGTLCPDPSMTRVFHLLKMNQRTRWILPIYDQSFSLAREFLQNQLASGKEDGLEDPSDFTGMFRTA